MSSRHEPAKSANISFQRSTLATCACCGGFGLHNTGICPACEGKARFKVHPPSGKCSDCNGTGIQGARPAHYAQLCTRCYGTGWMLG